MGFEIPSSKANKLIFTPEMIGTHTIEATCNYELTDLDGNKFTFDLKTSAEINITAPNLRSTEEDSRHLFLCAKDGKFLNIQE